ncbi:MAG: restriction endonuclease [Proteobacteria bacterium]|nr:restriction endonuclease [Pseudomonadota bacterium]
MSDSSLFTSGSLFSTDYLVEGITASPAYRAINAEALRERLGQIASAFPQSPRTNESQTEDDFIWPVLTALGWSDSLRQQNLSATGRDDVPDGLLFANTDAKTAANAQGDQWRRYAHGVAVVESKRWARPLDRASGRDEATAPSTQMLRYLRRIDDLTGGGLRWGVLTNGTRWRLYWAGARSVSEEFLEIDLARVLGLDGGSDLFATDDDREHWLRVFGVMFGRDAFIRDGADNRSFHERARNEAAFYEERVATSLSKLVFEQVFPSLAAAIAEASPDSPLQEVREASLVLLYRLLFLLYAEDRDLLPVRDARYDGYALRPLRQEIGRRVSEGDVFSVGATRTWNHIADLARMIDKGDRTVGLPPYNGGLFAPERTPLLERVRIGDATMAHALDALSYDRSGGESRYINYRDLSVQQLGSIYERLLEFEIVREPTDDGHAGLLSVRPNLFARRNTGSYYTPDELVALVLDETLEPLISERFDAFHAALAGLDADAGELDQQRDLRRVDPAEAILNLRVCDPAMGSGHFLVSVVDKLADHVLEAMAEVATLGATVHYVSPLAEKIEVIRATIANNAEAASWTIDEAQLDDRHIVRRMVLKRCVYGVDKNPMAVELAKVALWLHTFTVGAPLSFIDHHLRSGDSLFGLWVRTALDKAITRGGGELLYASALKSAQAAAAQMQVIERLVDVEIAEAHKSADTYYGIQTQVAPLDSFVSLLHAFDWLNLTDARDRAAVRAWLDGIFGNPIDIAQGRSEPLIERARRDEGDRFATILSRARALISEERFLNWQVTFPGVWDDWADQDIKGGFDAVVGNPPWDRIKLQQVEWFAARRPEIARAQRASDRSRMIAELKAAEDPLFGDFMHADARAADTLRVVRDSGQYPLLGRGDLNLYSLFVERAFALVKPQGMVGLLVPSGIAADLSASAFFREVATKGRLKALYDFENRRTRLGIGPFFPDVDTRFKFCSLIASPAREFNSASCGFFLQAVAEISDPDRVFEISASDFARVNPNTGTAPIFRSRRDMALTTAVYGRLPVLVDHSSGTAEAAWPVRYATVFHMTNDSGQFRTRAELENREGAWRVGGNHYRSATGDWMPLFEGKMVQAFDHRAASVVVNAANQNRPAQPLSATEGQHADPNWEAEPQFWVAPPAGIARHPFTLGFKDVTAPTNVRSMIAAIIPSGAAGNTLPLIEVDPGTEKPSARRLALLVANLNSIIYDFIARQKIQGQHLNWFIVEQLPIVPPAAYSRSFGPKSAAEVVGEAVLELTYTAHDLAPFARDMGHVDESGEVLPPFIWDEDRRLALRAKLDAIYFILYGVFDPTEPTKSRDDIRYIYSTFPIVERQEVEGYGRYRSCDLALAWTNALLAGEPDADVAG